jgi:hypothetical protein
MANANPHQVEFDVTLDEVVDANMRLVEHTAAYRKPRTHYQWVAGVCVAGGLAVGILKGSEVPSYATLAVASCAALFGGLALGTLYGRYHDWHVRRSYRRLVSELYGGTERIACAFEVRDDALCCRSVHGDTSFPWSQLTRVEDVPGSIELWFNPGLAVVRDRAFRTQEERREFLEAVRHRLPGGVARRF